MAISFPINRDVYAVYPGIADLGTLDEFSFSAWIKLNANRGGVFEIYNSAGSSLSKVILYSATTVVVVIYRSIAISSYQTDAISGLDNWHNLVVYAKTGLVPDVYINGAKIQNNILVAGNGDPIDTTGELRLATYNAVNWGLNGSIADVGLWNRELTSSEIQLLANRYSPIFVPDDLVGCWRMYGDTGLAYEPDYAGNYNLTLEDSPPDTYSFAAHPDIITRSEDNEVFQPLGSSKSSHLRGTILRQNANISLTNPISKSSLYLNVINGERSDYIQEQEGIATWCAANFQDTSDRHEFILYDDSVSVYTGSDDIAENQGFLSNSNAVNFGLSDEVRTSSAYVKYNLYLAAGTYGLYVRGYGGGTFWYSWDDDLTLDAFTLPTNLIWRKIGDFHIEDPEFHDFYIYWGKGGAQAIKIDQFRMIRTDSTVSDDDIDYEHITYPSTWSPFNTFFRIRSQSTSDKAWSWKSSVEIRQSGWHNYDINEYNGPAGFTMDYIVISGTKNFNAQWAYTLPDTSAYSSYISTNYGNSFSKDS